MPAPSHARPGEAFRTVGRPEGFRVTRAEGPLCPGEVERANAWGRGLAGKVEQVEQPS